MKHLEFKQDYFTDLINNHEQTSYFLPENTLKAILERSVQRAQEHEEQERREREYEDNY
jgi:spore germination protein GerM